MSGGFSARRELKLLKVGPAEPADFKVMHSSFHGRRLGVVGGGTIAAA